MGEPPIPEDATHLPALLKEHGLTPDEYARIKQALGRTPTITELGIYSVMWSEHCSYKSSRVHLKRLPTRSKLVVQGPGENAGIIDIGDGWACAFKIESHNHPSYIEPFQGAATGVGGILRDIFTMGARPLAVMDSLRFGPLARGTGGSPADTLHKNHSILEGVVSGVAHYGNCFGVPNLGGETRFEPCYSGNPLVNAFALGLVRRDEIFYAKAAGIGNPVIYVGAKTGRDGIHGATMASAEFTAGSEQKRPNVQMGDPFLEKLLLEACLEAMRTGAIVGIQDMGAAGLTCSTCEMGARGAVGVEIELDLVPQRETGMTAYEIMLSESQERMLLVADKGREQEVFTVFEKWGLDAVTVGQVIPQNTMRVLKSGQVIAEIPNTSLTDDAPLYHRPIGEWQSPLPATVPAHIDLNAQRDCTADLKQLLASLNICSKRWIFEQYDTMVQTNTVTGPGADSDGGVMRIKGTRRGLAMALDGNSRWCYLDPKLGAQHAVAEAARNVACTGATPVAATNCLNFGNPEKPQIMRQLSDAIDGIAEACTALATPITGGNVSLYNETLGEGIYPTPVIGIVGIIEDISRSVKSAFVGEGDDILLLSAASETENSDDSFGSSEYAKEILGAVWGAPPALDLAREAALQKCILELINAGQLKSAHDCSDGGLAVALAESTFLHNIGASVEIPWVPHPDPERSEGEGWVRERWAELLFAESASRIVVSCDPSHSEDIQKMATRYGVNVSLLGITVADSLEIRINTKTAIHADISELKSAWGDALEQALGAVDPKSGW
ncbi:MAG: phosphoribosylformylglycinamidine synthase subunit PurL [Acidobacteriaceae bacterium]